MLGTATLPEWTVGAQMPLQISGHLKRFSGKAFSEEVRVWFIDCCGSLSVAR